VRTLIMAFIPDDALDRYGELQPASQLGYSFVCRYRNHKTGIAPKGFDECAAFYHWSRATKFNVQKELTEKSWVVKSSGGLVPLVGDFQPVNKSKNLDFQDTNKSKNLDSKSKNLDSKSKNLDSHIRNNQPLPAINQQEEEFPKGNLSSETLNGSFGIPATEVFSFWQAELNHTQAKFTNERRRRIINRLKEGYSVEQIKIAVKGCHLSPFHQGENDTGTKYDDIELICRKGSNIEKFTGFYEAYQANGESNDGTGIQKRHGGRFPETDAQRRQREAAERNRVFRQVDDVLAERDRVLQGESGANSSQSPGVCRAK